MVGYSNWLVDMIVYSVDVLRIEQLQALPPGLQMMLLNTEAVAEWLP